MTFKKMMGAGVLILLAAAAVALGSLGPDVAGAGVVTAMAVVQSAYSERMVEGLPGQVANMTNWDADTRTCETAAGIGFGLPVGQGSADKGAVLAGALAGFVGVSVRDVTLDHDTAALDEYSQNENMAVLTEGDIWVTTSVAALPSDPVHYNATTGAWLITGGEGPIVGARWMRSSAIGGRNVLRLSGHLPVA